MPMKLTPEESIFCQALATVNLLGLLHAKDFLHSEYYSSLTFPSNSDILKEILDKSGIGNPATLQMFLYILLVVPKELMKNIDEKHR